jgi:pyruvate dehydrogenase E1 component alpha subunit
MADSGFFDAIEQEAIELAAGIRHSCITMPDPEPLTLFDDVYAEPTLHLERQRREFGEYLDSFEEVAPR